MGLRQQHVLGASQVAAVERGGLPAQLVHDLGDIHIAHHLAVQQYGGAEAFRGQSHTGHGLGLCFSLAQGNLELVAHAFVSCEVSL
ncbi:hypothetical protein D3C78_1299110 [compost metagenome]